MLEILIVIPARYQSTRFPGKPLVDIHGKSMLRHVWEKCVEATSPGRVLVATDHDRNLEHYQDHDMQVGFTHQRTA